MHHWNPASRLLRWSCLLRVTPLLVFASVIPVAGAPTHLVEQQATAVTRLSDGTILADFGKVAFGNVTLAWPAKLPSLPAQISVHFGEASAGGRIDRAPPGTVRYTKAVVTLVGRVSPIVVAPPPDARNTDTKMNAVLTPAEWGVVLPFRWLEIEGWPADLTPPDITRRAAFATSWDDAAASFVSSDETLNRIWELCRYSIKATTFAGVYVDGDRERIPYEADAYLSQISHYTCDPDSQMARDTFDYLMHFPTWPTEWAQHMVPMAHADWMRTGDTEWIAARYKALWPKLLMERRRADGLLEGTQEQIKKDIVDWPLGERDGYVFKPVNTVVNAFHLLNLRQMGELARALGEHQDAETLAGDARKSHRAFQSVLFDPARGIYRDGEGTDHASLHANLFPLAFDLVPEEHAASVLAFVRDKGMRCSVYVAQYLLEALFRAGADQAALDLILAPGDRSWRHMEASGTTITWEAWDQRYKPNQDWNHAWGAAPANILPRFLLGVEAAEPGWRTVKIQPHPGNLVSCCGKVPSPRGPVEVAWKRDDDFTVEFALPDGVSAIVEVPAAEGATAYIDGQPARATRQGKFLQIEGRFSGRHRVEVSVRKQQ